MDEKTATALAKRLAAYSATASVAFALAPSAHAQVVYHDFEPDVVGRLFHLDFDDDGTDDLWLDRERGYGTYTYSYMYLQNSYCRLSCSYALDNKVVAEPPYALRLSSGELIGPGQPLGDWGQIASLVIDGPKVFPSGPFYGKEGYAGFRFIAGDGLPRYGWLRLSVETAGDGDLLEATLLDYAYESAPDTPIVAGDRGTVAVEPGPGGPGTHGLRAPSPNPTTDRSHLTLEVAEAQSVWVGVLDALGRRVALLHDGPLAAGVGHRLTFDGSGLPTGVYAVRAVGETFTAVRVLTLTR